MAMACNFLWLQLLWDRLPIAAILVASGAMAASKWPLRLHLTLDLNSMTYYPRLSWPVNASMRGFTQEDRMNYDPLNSVSYAAGKKKLILSDGTWNNKPCYCWQSLSTGHGIIIWGPTNLNQYAPFSGQYDQLWLGTTTRVIPAISLHQISLSYYTRYRGRKLSKQNIAKQDPGRARQKS